MQKLITAALTRQQLLYQPVSTDNNYERHVMFEGHFEVRHGGEDIYGEYVQLEARRESIYEHTGDETLAGDETPV